MKNRSERRTVASGEMLAIDPRSLIKGPDAFFWLFGPSCPPMKRVGSTAIIYIRGSLEHHADGWGCSYEQILEDARAAVEGDDDNQPAKKLILSIDSPGGVVSGLYECVDALKALGVPIHAYVEGICASAAYALATSCSKIYCSRSAILGSIGVIATMYSQKRLDQKMGIDVVTITSGKRKADGHPHVAISEDAIRAEEKRVRKFAKGFFALVEEARDFDPEPHEAGLFVGSDAVKAGYADAVKTLDEKTLAQSGASVADSDSTTEEDGTMRLTTLIDKTKAAIKSEKDPEKKAALRLKLAAYQTARADTKKTYEHEKEVEETTDEPEEEEEESDGDDDGDDDGGGGNDTDREDEAEDEEESAESEDEEESAEADDEDEKKASAALGKLKLKGAAKKAVALAQKALARSAAARQAMRGELKGQRALAKQVQQLAEANERRDRNAVIDGALAAARITPAEAKQLRKQSTDHVAAFLSARPKAIVRTNALTPDLKQAASAVSQAMGNVAPSDVTAEITAEMREAAERAEQMSDGKVKAADIIKEFQATSLNGKGVH